MATRILPIANTNSQSADIVLGKDEHANLLLVDNTSPAIDNDVTIYIMAKDSANVPWTIDSMNQIKNSITVYGPLTFYVKRIGNTTVPYGVDRL